MSRDEIIRTEIRQLLGVSEGRLSNIINHSNANMPLPIDRRKSGHNWINIYDRDEIMKWLATDPLKNAVVRPKENQKPSECFGIVSFVAFLFGVDGASSRLNRYQKIRPLVEKMSVINIDGDNGPLLN